MTAPLLSVRAVQAYYGHIAALKGVDVDVGEGEIVALIGANGAGKSTLMMTIFGNPRAREGQIIFAGRDITQLPTHEIARLKIAQAPEGRRIDTARSLAGLEPDGPLVQAARALMPFSVSRVCSSPAWNISRTISQPPMNSPLT